MGGLKAKLAKLRRELLTPTSAGGGGPGGKLEPSFLCTQEHCYVFKWNVRNEQYTHLPSTFTSNNEPKIVGFDVAKTGVGRIGFVGFPSVGKSTLMSKLTGTHSEIAAYEFTTLTTVPGVVQYNGAKLQILDLPGIIEGAKDGKGRGMFLSDSSELYRHGAWEIYEHQRNF